MIFLIEFYYLSFFILFMEQINFRLNPDEKKLLQIMAEDQSVTIAEIARQAVLKEIQPKRVNLAFSLLAKGKIGRKKAWILSGLTYHEFLIEWTTRKAEEILPDEITDAELEIIQHIDINKHLK